jgi:hypothetical protein
MNEIHEDELESENQDDGGETVEQETTETNEDQKDYKKIAEDQRKRAEKAEKDLKAKLAEKPPVVQPKPAEVTPTNDGLTSMDAIVLMGAKVTEKEDIEFVAEYAQFKKISIADALKSNVVKSELAEKAEVRATAVATNTGNARRGTSKPTDEQIVNNASAGKEVDPEALAEARLNLRKSKK